MSTLAGHRALANLRDNFGSDAFCMPRDCVIWEAAGEQEHGISQNTQHHAPLDGRGLCIPYRWYAVAELPSDRKLNFHAVDRGNKVVEDIGE